MPIGRRANYSAPSTPVAAMMANDGQRFAGLSSVQTPWREQMGDALAGRIGKRNAEQVMTAADFTPLGAAFLGNEARIAFNRGNTGEAAAGVALAAMPLPGAAKKGMIGAGRKVAQEVAPTLGKRGITAYQGSPARLRPEMLEGADFPNMVSTRRPTAPNYAKQGNPDERILIQSGTAMQDALKAYERNMQMLTQEPFMADMAGRPVDEIYRVAVERGAGNLNFIMNELMTPGQVDAARNWYPIAQTLSEKAAARAGVPDFAGYGVQAVFSPQTPWPTNVARTDRLMDMWGDGLSVTPGEARRYVENRLSAGKPDAIARQGFDYAQRIAETPIQDLTDDFDLYARAVLADAARNNPSVPNVNLDGTYGDPFGGITWGSGDTVGKAIRILSNPTIDTVNQQLLGGGKVPSFYNNIAAPFSRLPITTIDTHSAGAAALFPGGGADSIVYRGMGLGGPQGGAADSAVTGSKGLYGVLSDAHTLSAQQMGFASPREVQSATWEGVRGMWGMKDKTPQLKADVAEIWRTSRTPDEARFRIAERVGRPVRRYK